MDLALKLPSEAVRVLFFRQVECEAERRFSWLIGRQSSASDVFDGGWNTLVERAEGRPITDEA
jgi:hypothetical protein